MPRPRRTSLLGVAALMMVATALPAAAQTVGSQFAADASAGVVRVTAQGSGLVAVGETTASLRDDAATATATALSVADDGAGQAEAVSTGGAVSDPAEGDGCEVPVDALTGVLDLGLVCGTATAHLDAGTASATAGAGEAQVLTLDVEGGAIGQIETVLFDDLGLAQQLDEQAGAALEALVDPLAEECDIAVAELTAEAPVLAELPLEEVAGGLDEIIDQLEGELPVVCEVLQTLVDVLAGEEGVISGGGLSGILDGTAGVIELTLLQTTSDVEADGSSVVADARPNGAVELSLNLPLGEALQSGLEDILNALGEGVLGEIGAPVYEEVGLSPDDPAGDMAAQILGTEGISGLLDGQLLAATLTPGRAAVSVAQSSGGTNNVIAEPAIVTLGGSIFELPPLAGLDAALNEGAGQLDEALLAALRDTPLADLISVTLLQASTDTDATVAGLPGATAQSGAATLQLLAAADGGLTIEVSPANAAAGATEVVVTAPDVPEPAPEPEPLPRTGAGLALAGLITLAGAAGLRRRP